MMIKVKVYNKKAVLWARVSSKEQEQGFSPDAQVRLLKEYAQKHNIKIARRFVVIEPGGRKERKNFYDMIAYLKSHPDIKTLLCEKTDRLYRNFRDFVVIDDLNIELHFAKENEIISAESSSHVKFIHGIKLLMAKNYIDNLSEETLKGMREKARQGYYPSRAPIGYNNISVDSKKLVAVDSERAPLIYDLFCMRATGKYSLDALYAISYKRGLRNRGGRKVGRATIDRILKNSFYCGDFNWGGVEAKGKYEPIITRELFDQVQMTSKSKRYKDYITTKRTFPYTGLLTCGRCGCSITAECKKKKYVYYRCTRAKGHCGNKPITQSALEEQLDSIVKTIHIDGDILHHTVERLRLRKEEEQQQHEDTINALNAQKNRLQHRIEKMYEDKLDGNISEDFYQQKMEAWQKEINAIDREIEEVDEMHTDNALAEHIKTLELSKGIYDKYLEHDSFGKREILNYALSNCLLNDLTLYPTYSKPFDLIAKGL